MQKNQPSYGWRVAVGFVALAALGAPPSAAAEQLTPWRTMHSNSYPATVIAAVQQCYDAGMAESVCGEFQTMLQTDQCQPAIVPDGAEYDWMGGRSGISRNLRKELGGDTQTLVCQLTRGPTLHWYTGYVGACNNVGLYRGSFQSFGRQTIRTERPGPVIDRPTIYKCNGCVLMPRGTVQLPGEVWVESAPGQQLIPPHFR